MSGGARDAVYFGDRECAGSLDGARRIVAGFIRTQRRIALTLLACAAPAFLAGFTQDFTEALTPRGRLLATAFSALLAFLVMGAAIRTTSIPGLDWVVTFSVGSLFVTMFAVAGIANAVNIIDGFNGLASMCTVLMLAAIAYVSFQVFDPLIG